MTAAVRVLALFALGWAACTPTAERDVVHVYAAASLTDVADALAERYQFETGTRVVLNLAASSTLARQIAAGAPADVFLSADSAWAAHVLTALPDSRRVPLPIRTHLAVLRRVGTPTLALTDAERIALGDPAHVPAGRYAADWLHCLGMWDAVAPRLVPTLDTRAAVQTLRLAAADLALAYTADAQGLSDVTVQARADGACAPDVHYTAVVVRPDTEAEVFAAFVADTMQADVWQRFGFGRTSEGTP